MGRYSIESSKLNRGYSILLICDNHDTYSGEWFRDIESPDIILIAGDFIMGKKMFGRPYKECWTEHCPKSYEMFKELISIAPVYLSLGNHEWSLSDEDIDVIRSMGINVLDNEYVRISDDLVVGGLTSGLTTNLRKFRLEKYDGYGDVRGKYNHAFYRSGKTDYVLTTPEYEWLDEFEKEGGYKILLSHHPEYWTIREPKLEGREIDLVLSGHAHGGQIRLFGQGLYAPGQGLLPKYTKGEYKGRYGEMIVSAGLSNTYKVPRVFNRLEVVEVIFVKQLRNDFEKCVSLKK